MIRTLALALICAIASPAWVESVEFPWNAYPKPLWERALVRLKNIGIMHVSLPPAGSAADLNDVIRIIGRLDMQADLEGPVPESLEALKSDHGGPLTDPLPAPAPRISALAATALTRARESLLAGNSGVIWTDVQDTVGPAGFHAGVISFTGEEKPAVSSLHRAAQLAAFWRKSFASLHAAPGAGIVIPAQPASKTRAPGPLVRQFAGERDVSLVSVLNKSGRAWTGTLKVMDPVAKHTINIDAVTVPAHDALWLPVDIPLTAGPLCKNCTAFANGERLVYATAELTTLEYENGILAMEFSAPAAGKVVLQLAHEPSGPFVAGGKPVSFDWDDQAKRARLTIPAGKGPGDHVRIGIAIDAPDATAFFDEARVLTIGETNSLTAQFSSEAIAKRSRLRTMPPLELDQEPAKEPLSLTYLIKVPATFVHGDHADLAIEADGMQMSHAHPALLLPVRLSFPDALDVHLASDAALPLFPSTIAVNQRTGRDLTVSIRNNAPAIRNFTLEPKVDGIDFSPVKLETTVGVSTSRDVSFHVFTAGAKPGLHAGAIAVSGDASAAESIQFVVVPRTGAVAYATSGFSFLESARTRASFMPGRWLEFLNKDTNQNQLASTGVPFTPGTIEIRGDALGFQDQRVLRLDDLEQLAAKSKSATDAHR